VELLQHQENIAHELELGARELSYLSNDFLLHGENQQRTRWEAKFSSFSDLLVGFVSNDPGLAALVNDMKVNKERLKTIFIDVASTLQNGPAAGGYNADLAILQVAWSRMEVQNQGIAFNASRLDRMLEEHADGLRHRRVILLFILIGISGAFLVINYVTVNRRILRAISNLQAGTRIIGSGNLDFAIEEKEVDEIGDLSRAFNQMTADLKAVTASKADLEREISERRHAEEALRLNEERLKRSQEIAHLGSWELDLEKNELTWSDEAYRIFGLQPQQFDATYEAFLATVHPDDRKKVDEAYSASLRDNIDTYEVEHRVVRPDGEIRFVHEKCEHYRDASGRIIRSAGMVHDITDRKRTQEALERSNSELEQFAYVASHDLQEPLRAIVGFLQLLQSRYENQIDETGRHFIERSVKAGHRMQTLIRELLTLSRVNTKGATFASTDLNDLVKDVLDSLQSIILEKNADISCARLPNLTIDASQIQSLFQNLILNAVRYNESPKPIIEIGCREDENVYHFFVKDNGIGILPKFYQRIFMVFQRLHTGREYPGTGLGLALCKKIVERHGGTIWVESQPQAGSMFHFTLPKKR
jgi:PAS domain S-box-containing protein